MESSKRNTEKVLQVNLTEKTQKPNYQNLKQINWLTVIISLGLGIIAIITTYTNPHLQILLGIMILFMFLLGAVKKSWKKSEQKQKIKINKFENRLFYIAAFFLTPNMRESALGDKEEIYHKDVKRFGRRRANRLLLRDIICSVIPQLYNMVRRIIVKLMKLVGLYEIYRRLLG